MRLRAELYPPQPRTPSVRVTAPRRERSESTRLHVQFTVSSGARRHGASNSHVGGPDAQDADERWPSAAQSPATRACHGCCVARGCVRWQ
jgi:hypothetical protein